MPMFHPPLGDEPKVVLNWEWLVERAHEMDALLKDGMVTPADVPCAWSEMPQHAKDWWMGILTLAYIHRKVDAVAAECILENVGQWLDDPGDAPSYEGQRMLKEAGLG